MKQNRVLHWASVAFCAASLFLVIGNILLVNGNKGLQRDINSRQQQISDGRTFGQIYQSLVQALADFSVNQNDGAVRTMLAEQGIKFPDKATASSGENAGPRKKKQ